MQQELALVEHLLVLNIMIDIDKIIDEIIFELKKLNIKNLHNLKQLNHYKYLNQFSPKFSWLNPKCKRKLIDNCKIILTDINEDKISEILKKRGIEPIEFVIYHFTNKLWEQILKKNSKQIVAIQGTQIVTKNELKINIKPFSIIYINNIDFFYTPTNRKWVSIKDGVRFHKNFTLIEIKNINSEITEELRKYNINLILSKE